jgi:hypothetical protein
MLARRHLRLKPRSFRGRRYGLYSQRDWQKLVLERDLSHRLKLPRLVECGMRGRPGRYGISGASRADEEVGLAALPCG